MPKCLHKSNISQAGFSPNETAVNRNLIDFFQVAHDPRDGAAVIAFADDNNDFDGHTYYTRQIRGPGLLAARNPTQPSCPPLAPLMNPEVIDFRGDANGVSGLLGASDPTADILSIDYGSTTVGSDLFLTADMAITTITPGPPPPGKSYRAYFAVNTMRGLMDTGNEYFIEVHTGNPSPEYWLGVLDRRADGSFLEQRVERIDADQIGAPFVSGGLVAPGVIRLRVKASRLDYKFIADTDPSTDGDQSSLQDGGSTPPGNGSLVIGLRGRTRIAAGSATSTFLDETRGGSFIFLGPPPPPPPNGDPVVFFTMRAPIMASLGSTIVYEMSCTNLGPNPSANAKITGVLPAELDFVSATNGGLYNAATRTVTWELGTVPVDFTGTIYLTARVKNTVAVGAMITNQAEYTADLTVATPAAAGTFVVP